MFFTDRCGTCLVGCVFLPIVEGAPSKNYRGPIARNITLLCALRTETVEEKNCNRLLDTPLNRVNAKFHSWGKGGWGGGKKYVRK